MPLAARTLVLAAPWQGPPAPAQMGCDLAGVSTETVVMSLTGVMTSGAGKELGSTVLGTPLLPLLSP